MKRILAIVLCLFCLCSCGTNKPSQNDKLEIVTTIFPIYDFVRAVGGEEVSITLLIDPGTEVHSFDPKPSDIKAIYNSDLFIYTGGESDEWVNRILGDKQLDTLKMMEYVDTLDEHKHSHEHGHDEHIWTSAENAILMLEGICKALVEKDPKNAEGYKGRCQSYIDKIEVVNSQIKDVVNSSKEKFILVADRFPFIYFTELYGIEYEAAFGGCAVSTDISIKTMSRLVETCRQRNLAYAYYTELSNKNIANALAAQTGIKLLELHSAHNVTLEDFNNGITYVDIMRRNIEALKEGMNGCP
ncbi:MAG: zinc ABC transporter substrate-binding protein [Clostridia bacterium]|nr:zinc ABC transporter substrate-binding protein [Clostridia bacterium]